jgi:hypothetical protein
LAGFEQEKSKEKTAGGSMGFENLAKTIASRWKVLSPERLKYYKELAEADMKRYRAEMEVYTRQAASEQTQRAQEFEAQSRVETSEPPPSRPTSQDNDVAAAALREALLAYHQTGQARSQPSSTAQQETARPYASFTDYSNVLFRDRASQILKAAHEVARQADLPVPSFGVGGLPAPSYSSPYDSLLGSSYQRYAGVGESAASNASQRYVEQLLLLQRAGIQSATSQLNASLPLQYMRGDIRGQGMGARLSPAQPPNMRGAAPPETAGQFRSQELLNQLLAASQYEQLRGQQPGFSTIGMSEQASPAGAQRRDESGKDDSTKRKKVSKKKKKK